MSARFVALTIAMAAVTAAAPSEAAPVRLAPPTLTPLVARQVVAACPGTERYADALVSGIREADAAAAAPLFDACAASHRRDYANTARWAASTAVGATYLSLGLLRHDPALLRRAVDATTELRSLAIVDDGVIRSWPTIPDFYNASHQTAIIVTTCI